VGVKTSNPDEIVRLLQEARRYLALPGNDFTRSSWRNTTEAQSEIDSLISRLESGNPPGRSDVAVLFASTGDIQEVSLSSGWGKQFLEVAEKMDAAVDRHYGPDPRVIAAHKRELSARLREVFCGKLRWFFTILCILSAAFTCYMYFSRDYAETWFPIHLGPRATFYAVIAASIIYGALALINWVSWGKRDQRTGPCNPKASRP
jgi:hypothetical protein